MKKSFFTYLGIGEIGHLELLFAVSPILSGYSLLGLPLSFVVWLLVLILSFIKHNNKQIFRPLLFLLVYVALHDILLVIGVGKNFNGYLNTLLYLLSIIYLSRSLNLNKLRGAINIVSIVLIVGLLYQYSMILTTGGVHPLEIPGLQMPQDRFDTFSLRPSSFFMEPAVYAEYMFMPISLSLLDRRYLWAGLLMFFVLLTGSTTGFITVFLLIIVYVLTQGVSFKYTFVLFSIGTILIYLLLNSTIFEVGLEKMEGTNFDTNIRINQGIIIDSYMSLDEYIFGVACAGPYEFTKLHSIPNIKITEGNAVFMPTFWYILLCFGIIGLFLYLRVYWIIAKQCRQCIPLVIVVISLLFTNGISMSVEYVYLTSFMLVLYYNFKNEVAYTK